MYLNNDPVVLATLVTEVGYDRSHVLHLDHILILWRDRQRDGNGSTWTCPDPLPTHPSKDCVIGTRLWVWRIVCT